MPHTQITSLAGHHARQMADAKHVAPGIQTTTSAIFRRLALLGLCLALQACAVVAVADAAVTVVATGVKVTAKAVGAVASAVIPGDKDGK